MAIPQVKVSIVPEKTAILTKAVLRSADLLHISRKELAEIIGLSEATLSRIYQNKTVIPLETKMGETALQWVRIYRSLDSIFGGKSDLCIKWLRAPNDHLGGIPLQLIKKIEGLIHVVRYLDAMRAKI